MSLSLNWKLLWKRPRMIWLQIRSALMRDLSVSIFTPCLARFSVKSFGVARIRRAMLA